MKNVIQILILLLCLSCKNKNDAQKEYDKQYSLVIREMAVTMDQLGNYKYSPDGNDSIWETTDSSYNLTILDKVLNELPDIERKWDSLIFLSEKYDSIPAPSDNLFGAMIKTHERKINIINRKYDVMKLVDAGKYDKNGKELKKPD